MSGLFGLVQARMGSSRLPGKVLKPLVGKPLVGHIFDRLLAVKHIEGVVLATTIDPRNDPMITYAESRGILVYRAAEENDIAGRLAGAARLTGAEAFLKVNADCPMIDPSIMQLIVDAWRSNSDADYVSNKVVWTWPEGMSAELIGRSAIEYCDKKLKTPEEREFVANWVRDHRELFKVVSVEGPENLTRYKWSVDTPEDFSEAELLFNALYPIDPLFGLEALKNYLRDSEA